MIFCRVHLQLPCHSFWGNCTPKCMAKSHNLGSFFGGGKIVPKNLMFNGWPGGVLDKYSTFPETSRLAPVNGWMFPKIGVPPNNPFNRAFNYKPSILGYPYFWKHPDGWKTIFLLGWRNLVGAILECNCYMIWIVIPDALKLRGRCLMMFRKEL